MRTTTRSLFAAVVVDVDYDDCDGLTSTSTCYAVVAYSTTCRDDDGADSH